MDRMLTIGASWYEPKPRMSNTNEVASMAVLIFRVMSQASENTAPTKHKKSGT